MGIIKTAGWKNYTAVFEIFLFEYKSHQKSHTILG
jgi:hypothetical protein